MRSTSNLSTVRARRRGIVGTMLGVTATLALVGCSASADPASQVSNTSNNVPFTDCTPELCAGTLDGKYPFKIEMPTKWNGTLVLYSHEYRPTVPLPLGTEVGQVSAVVGPEWTIGTASVSKSLLAEGYALAGAASPDTGWQVAAQISAADSLYTYFKEKIAAPSRVYTWGPSTGAVASANLAENREWVNGSAPMCGQLAGVTRNYDLALDAAFAVKQLLYPQMKLVNYSSLAEAKSTYLEAVKRVRAATVKSYGPEAKKVEAIGVAAVIPPEAVPASDAKTAYRSRPARVAAGLEAVLARSTFERFAIEQQFGGNPSSNVGTDYFSRVTAADIKSVDRTLSGSLAKNMAKITKGERVSADPTARSNADASPGVSGKTRVPTVSLHTAYDVEAILQNEGAVVTSAVQAGGDARRLFSVNVIAPVPGSLNLDPSKQLSPEELGPKPGTGHCSFTAESVYGNLKVLDDWVRKGLFPSAEGTKKALGEGSGYAPNFPLFQWPPGPTN